MISTLTVLRDKLRRVRPPADSGVHFHNGPQGQPTPCFDHGCPNPRLSI
jgi:hypothetical protein